MLIHTEEISSLEGFRLNVRFNNGVSGQIDLSDELWGEVFLPLKDAELFATTRQDPMMRTVVWANGADFAPEFLLDLLIKQTKATA